jgi:beta-glucosidase
MPTPVKIFGLVLVLSASAVPTIIAAGTKANDSASTTPLWRDPSKSPEQRANDLVHRMTLEEKASQITANPPAIPRLGIPAYSHRNEGLHGMANGTATVFPQAIAMAATWDIPLIKKEADVIATEGRAKHNDYVASHNGNTGEHFGLNFYSPNINIFRDPRWGRGQETYGEDPLLTSQMGVAFIQGLQGDDPRYVKIMACAKHFAVHSGPEKERHHFNATPPEQDLYDTYLPAFEASVREGKVGSVMGAYSALYGKPCCADPFLLTDLLRTQWGFKGIVFSDGGAIGDIWAEHHYVPGPVEAAAAAVRAGCDISSGGMGKFDISTTSPGHLNRGLKGGSAFSALPDAVTSGLITEKEINTAVMRELVLRFRLGLFDPASIVPFSNLGAKQIDTPEHRALALKVAQESLVLLKNEGVLPLDRKKIRKIAVIGPNADSAGMQNGNYTGKPSRSVTILQGIKTLAGPEIQVTYAKGCPLALNRKKPHPASLIKDASAAMDAANGADIILFVSGIDATLEKEEGSPRSDIFEGFSRGDRTRIELPAQQEKLIKALEATGKPVVLVNCSGSAMALPWEKDHLPAIVQAWYPGEEGGTAVAQLLFGEINPAGRLPVTFYSSTADLPPFTDYSMKNRTYRYFTGKPLFAFGQGLSYTTFMYSDLKTTAPSVARGGTIKLSFTVTNTGSRDGDEVAQIYASHASHGSGTRSNAPRQSLCGFRRVHVPSGASMPVTFEIPASALRHWDTATHQYVIDPGEYTFWAGSASDHLLLHCPITISNDSDGS